MHPKLIIRVAILSVLTVSLVILYVVLMKWIPQSNDVIKNPVQSTLSNYLLPENIIVSHAFVNMPIELDRPTLINLRNFKFLINNDRCQLVAPIILILVHSAPRNIDKRHVIRTTWGRKLKYVATFFLVGCSEEYNRMMETENENYKDMIQGNFIDSYYNMTYKHGMAFKWITYHCPGVKYVLKLDDDVFVNIQALLRYSKYDIPPFTPTNLILCNVIEGTKVKRSWRSKWRVSSIEYTTNNYPSYCAGWAIVYSADVIILLYEKLQKEPYFWIDDVHVTGTLVKKLNLTLTSMDSKILQKNYIFDLLTSNITSNNFLFYLPNRFTHDNNFL